MRFLIVSSSKQDQMSRQCQIGLSEHIRKAERMNPALACLFEILSVLPANQLSRPVITSVACWRRLNTLRNSC